MSGSRHIAIRTGHITAGSRHITVRAGHVTTGSRHVTVRTGHVTTGSRHVTVRMGHIATGSRCSCRSLTVHGSWSRSSRSVPCGKPVRGRLRTSCLGRDRLAGSIVLASVFVLRKLTDDYKYDESDNGDTDNS